MKLRAGRPAHNPRLESRQLVRHHYASVMLAGGASVTAQVTARYAC
jgi:hypothetical protein